MLTYQIKKPFQGKTKVSIIWLHGLGASGSDLVPVLSHPAIAKLPASHVFLDAPIRPVTFNNGIQMRAWYDIFGIGHPEEDQKGLSASHDLILKVIESIKKEASSPEKIILAGFSQGGAMALYTALRTKELVSGVIALSSWLPLRETAPNLLPRTTPFFLAFGKFDSIVLPEWTKQSADWLSEKGYEKTVLREYPMEHTLCMDEIRDIANWLSTHPAILSED